MSTSTAPIAVIHPGDALSRSQRLALVLVLGALTALGPFTVDMYLPALPQLEADLDSTMSVVQLTLTATTVGFGIGQLVVGPWSDRVGRRLPLILAAVVHIGACIGAGLAPNVEVLALFRFLQGAGAAASGVVAMASVRDLFSGHRLVRMTSNLGLVNGLAPILAPVIGSQLLLAMSWRWLFVILAVYGAFVVGCVVMWIRETLPEEARHDRGHATGRERYLSVLTDRVFIGIVLVGSFNFSGLFAYLSSSTFLFQDLYRFTPQQYGLLFSINAIGVIAGVQTAGRITHWVKPQWTLAVSTAVMVVSAALIVIFSAAGLGIWGIVVPLWFFICAVGFGFPSVGVLAMNPHPHEAGTAASLLGASQFVIAGLTSPITGMFGVTSGVPMGAVMLGFAALSVIALWAVVRPKTVPSIA